ncbi:MAG: glycerol-3-phosphate 1-O-acyltransferase PlsY [Elusimicrobia bacterium]|nr:glycerol-3-phosphate 1-O-acyltransferase PlsY [Elusimicrobiota bacterium]
MQEFDALKTILYAVGAFLLGSIPFSYVITKLVAKKDIRDVGSGNPGATNVVRALNARYGLLVLLLDLAKGAVPVYFAKGTDNTAFVYAIALAIVLGHDYTPVLGFKGGKGVASSLGIFIVLAPIPTLVVSMIFTLVTVVFKFVSFGSVMASFSYPIVAYLLGYTRYIGLATILGLMIIYRHKENLKRLWHGNEKRSI